MPKFGRTAFLRRPKRTLISLEQWQYDKLKKVAQFQRTSVTELIRRAVDEKYFPTQEQERELEAA